MLAFCYLLVARRIVREVVLTRLPTGHTHEDIDSVFGVIWEYIKGKYCYTPDMYEGYILHATRSRKPRVIDIMVVPDFIKLFTPCIDKKLERFAVEHYTQHQWRFTADDNYSMYEDGVKVSHREYSSQVYCKIIEDKSPTSILGLKPVNIESVDFPEPGDAPMRILQSMPMGPIQPEGFIEG
jgi:hypothetical protein